MVTSVRSRRVAGLFFEQATEVVGVVETEVVGDVLDRQVRGELVMRW